MESLLILDNLSNKMGQRQKTKQKKKQEIVQAQVQKQEKIQKQLLLLLVFTVVAALGRAALQGIPSVEPVTALAILSGMLFGRKKGAAVGASSFFLSNFLVWGGQGPWTIFQVFGAGIAGFLGGFLKKKSLIPLVVVTVAATLIFELSVNLWWSLQFGLLFGIFSLPLAFITSLPFFLTHIITNIAFVMGVPRFAKFIENRFKVTDVFSSVFRSDGYNSTFFGSWTRRKGSA